MMTQVNTDVHNILLCNSATKITLSLPNAGSNQDRVYQILNINVGEVVIDPTNSISINDGRSYSLISKYQGVTIVSDGVKWLIIGGVNP